MTAPADRDALVELMAESYFGGKMNWTNPALQSMRNILTDIEAAGCVVVPVEATQEMLDRAGLNSLAFAKRWPDVLASSPYRVETER